MNNVQGINSSNEPPKNNEQRRSPWKLSIATKKVVAQVGGETGGPVFRPVANTIESAIVAAETKRERKPVYSAGPTGETSVPRASALIVPVRVRRGSRGAAFLRLSRRRPRSIRGRYLTHFFRFPREPKRDPRDPRVPARRN